MNEKYRDMLALPHPVSQRHPPMPLESRAAQFSPFSALSGYGGAIQEAGRRTEAFIELDESQKEQLDRKLRKLFACQDQQPEITAVYFRPDEKKSGGAYLQAIGRVEKIDPVRGVLVLTDGTVIPFPALYALREGADPFPFPEGPG